MTVQRWTDEMLDNLASSTTELHQGSTELRESVTELRGSVTELREGFAEVRESITKIKDSIDGLRITSQALLQVAAQSQRDMEAMKERQAEMEQRQAEFRQRPEKNEQRQKNKEPNDLDVSKLNSEVNQYINQRLVVTTTAITVFGVCIGWIVYGSSTPTGIEVKPITFLIPTILTILLFILFSYCQVILGNIEIITAYLRTTEKSNWEVHYKEYEKKFPYFTQDKIFSIIFGGLGIFIALIVVVIWFTSSTRELENVQLFAGVFLTLIIIYLVLVYCAYKKYLLTFGDNSYNNWLELLSPEKFKNK